MARRKSKCAACQLLSSCTTLLQLHEFGSQADGSQAETTLQQQLPTMLQYIADTLRHASSKVVIAGCNELEGDAAVAAVAYNAQHTGQGVFHAFVELQHCYHILQACPVPPQRLLLGILPPVYTGNICVTCLCVVCVFAVGNLICLLAANILLVVQLEDRHKQQLAHWSAQD